MPGWFCMLLIAHCYVQPTENKNLGVSIHAALEHQAETAERMRKQQEREMPREDVVVTEKEEEVQLLTEEAVKVLDHMPADLAREGPIQVAQYLVKEATLNKDQRAPVALIAHDMHDAWVKQGRPERMSP